MIIGKNDDADMFEITLKKHFFGLEDDIKILFVYASPLNSGYTKSRSINVLDKLETIVLKKENKYLIMGDLNGHTKLKDDFVTDSDDKYTPINNEAYQKDIQITRQNMDKKPLDEQGKKY